MTARRHLSCQFLVSSLGGIRNRATRLAHFTHSEGLQGEQLVSKRMNDLVGVPFERILFETTHVPRRLTFYTLNISIVSLWTH